MNGATVALTGAEFRVLELLMRSAGQVISREALTEQALLDGVIDVRFDSALTEIVTAPAALMAVKDALEAGGLTVTAARLAMEAKQTSNPGADTAKVVTFLEALEEHEDVQTVFSNAEFDDAALEALA